MNNPTLRALCRKLRVCAGNRTPVLHPVTLLNDIISRSFGHRVRHRRTAAENNRNEIVQKIDHQLPACDLRSLCGKSTKTLYEKRYTYIYSSTLTYIQKLLTVLIRALTQVGSVFILDTFEKKRKRLPRVQRDSKSEVFLPKLFEVVYIV